MAAPAQSSLLDHVSALMDPHQSTKVLYPLPTTSLKNRRKRAVWNTSYLETLTRQTA